MEPPRLPVTKLLGGIGILRFPASSLSFTIFCRVQISSKDAY